MEVRKRHRTNESWVNAKKKLKKQVLEIILNSQAYWYSKGPIQEYYVIIYIKGNSSKK